MTNNLKDNLRLLDMIEEHNDEDLDTVDFNWLDDNSLVNIAMDYDKVKDMDEENLHALVWELARRLDDYLRSDDEDS